MVLQGPFENVTVPIKLGHRFPGIGFTRNLGPQLERALFQQLRCDVVSRTWAGGDGWTSQVGERKHRKMDWAIGGKRKEDESEKGLEQDRGEKIGVLASRRGFQA